MAVKQLIRLEPRASGHAVISDASDPVVSKLEATYFVGTPLFFFGTFLGPYDIQSAPNLTPGIARFRAATRKALDEHNKFYTENAELRVDSMRGVSEVDAFTLDPRLRDAALHPQNTLLLESLNPTLFNKWTASPKLSGKFLLRPYAQVHDFLVYIPSTRGPLNGIKSRTPIWRFESDFSNRAQFMEAVGRYLLFNVVNPSRPLRVELSITNTVMRGGRTALPPASVVGADRYRFGAVGYGAARLFSPPITPQIIGGLSFIELDLGRDGARFPDHRQGIMKWYGGQYSLDPRLVVSFVRDISVISDEQYRSLRAPTSLTSFPKSLEDPNLEFSGLYENGWMASRSIVWLSAPKGGSSTLVLKAMVPYQAVRKGTKVTVMLDGRVAAEVQPRPGAIDVQVPARADGRRHKIELRANTTFRLPNGDERPASMLIQYLGFD